MTKKIISVVLVLMMALAFVSCDGNILKKNKEKKEYKTVNSVILPMSPVRTLNPAATIDEDTYFISKLVYDSLFILDEHMVPKGSLAKNYSFNAGEKSLTIDLIETTWQDGEALTGEDVAFTINAYKKAGEACQYNSTVSKIDYVNASGNQVTIFFYEKNNMAIDMLTFPIIPEHGFKSTAEAIKGDGAFIPMGSGQYKCDSYNATDKLVLAPNENYHGEKAINTLTFEVMPGKENAYKLLETSGISLMISKAMDRETEIRNKSIKIENFPMNEVEFLGFNFYRESLKKPEVRKAIA
ncbi:MAG: ABC transporter substrate-binding protein, partial [Anaerovoracaceae bacterium]